MNKNRKTARIELRVTPEVKKRIERLAKKCGLSTAEYVCKRAMGYQPKAAVPEAFFDFNNSLCELLNRDLSPETEAAALRLFDEIHAEFINTEKQTVAEICKEALTGSPQSLLCGEEEHPRSGEPFDDCGESDERSVM